MIDKKVNFLTNEAVQTALKTQQASENSSFVLLGITHDFDTLTLPISIDCGFLYNAILNECYETIEHQITIRGCFNYGLKFHTELWRGFSHLAIVEFENGIPDEIHLLPSDYSKKLIFSLYFTSKEQVDDLKIHIMKTKTEFDSFMEEKNPLIYQQIQAEKEEYLKSLK